MEYSQTPGAIQSRRWRKANPEKDKAARARYREKYRETLKEKRNALAAKNREKELARASKWQAENWDEIKQRRADRLEQLAGRPRPDVCEVCEESSDRKLAFDHCHDNGHFRGWLCHKCNLALGLMRDNPALLKKLAGYIESDWLHQRGN